MNLFTAIDEGIEVETGGSVASSSSESSSVSSEAATNDRNARGSSSKVQILPVFLLLDVTFHHKTT